MKEGIYTTSSGKYKEMETGTTGITGGGRKCKGKLQIFIKDWK